MPDIWDRFREKGAPVAEEPAPEAKPEEQKASVWDRFRDQPQPQPAESEDAVAIQNTRIEALKRGWHPVNAGDIQSAEDVTTLGKVWSRQDEKTPDVPGSGLASITSSVGEAAGGLLDIGKRLSVGLSPLPAPLTEAAYEGVEQETGLNISGSPTAALAKRNPVLGEAMARAAEENLGVKIGTGIGHAVGSLPYLIGAGKALQAVKMTPWLANILGMGAGSAAVTPGDVSQRAEAGLWGAIFGGLAGATGAGARAAGARLLGPRARSFLMEIGPSLGGKTKEAIGNALVFAAAGQETIALRKGVGVEGSEREALFDLHDLLRDGVIGAAFVALPGGKKAELAEKYPELAGQLRPRGRESKADARALEQEVGTQRARAEAKAKEVEGGDVVARAEQEAQRRGTATEPVQEDAIARYARFGYGKVNEALRSGDPQKVASNLPVIKALDTQIAELPERPGTTFRFVGPQERASLAGLKEGDTYRPEAYLSTHKDRATADRVMSRAEEAQGIEAGGMVVEIRGRSGRDIEQRVRQDLEREGVKTDVAGEGEVLYPRGAEFRVVEKTAEKVVLEEVAAQEAPPVDRPIPTPKPEPRAVAETPVGPQSGFVDTTVPRKVWEKAKGALSKWVPNVADEVAIRADRKRRAEEFVVAEKIRRISKELTPRDMEDIGAAIEGIGHLESGQPVNLKDFSPAKRRAYAEIRSSFDKQRQSLNEFVKSASGGKESEFLSFVEDYLPHFYADSPQQLKAFAQKWSRNSPNAKRRKFPTLKEATDYGLKPITQNAAELLRRYVSLNWRVATTKDAIYSFTKMQMEDGRKAVVGDRTKAPPDYVKVDNEIVRRFRYGGKTKDGKGILLFRDGAFVHPDAVEAMRAMTDSPISGKIYKAVETYNAVAKNAQLTFSLFHDVSLLESAQATLGPIGGIVRVGLVDPATGKRMVITTPKRAGARLLEKGVHGEMTAEEFARDAIENGLSLSVPSEVRQSRMQRLWDAMDQATGGHPAARATGRKAKQFFDARQEMLWGFHRKLKAISYYELVRKLAPKVDPKDLGKLKQEVAAVVNDAYGGQEWASHRFMRNPRTRQAVHALVFAPDWSLSNLRITNPGLGEAYKVGKIGGGSLNPRRRIWARYWKNMVLGQMLLGYTAQAAIYGAFGDKEKGDKALPYENEDGRNNPFFPDVDLTPLARKVRGVPVAGHLFGGQLDSGDTEEQRVYIHGGKQAREVGRYITDPVKLLFAKSSPVVRQAISQFSGTEGPGWTTDFQREEDETGDFQLLERLKFIASDFVPFSLRGGQFALSVPSRKGMTPYKAGVAVSQALREYAEPGFLTKAMGLEAAKARPDVSALVMDVLEAARLNGHDPEKALRNGVSQVRGHYYRALYDKLQEGENVEGTDDAARAVVRLNAGLGNIERSMEARGLDLSKETKQMLWSAMKAAAEAEGTKAIRGTSPSITPEERRSLRGK